MYVKSNIEARSRNHCCRGKAISITYSEWVSVALVIQHAKRMRRIILSSVACPALQNFSTLSHKRHDFRKKLLNTTCVFWFSLQRLCETSVILRRIHRYRNVYRSSCKYPLFLSDLNRREFSRQIFQESSNMKFHENLSSESRVVPCGRTDRHNKSNGRFMQFCKSL
jgi:hypothetical protein